MLVIYSIADRIAFLISANSDANRPNYSSFVSAVFVAAPCGGKIIIIFLIGSELFLPINLTLDHVYK